MTHISQLLHDAAPRPTRDLDVEALAHRARRPSRRRWLAWLGAMVAAATAVVAPGELGLVAGSGGDRRVETVMPAPTTPAPTTSRVDAPAPVAASETDPRPGPATPRSRPAPPAVLAANDASMARSTDAPAPSTTTPAPVHEGCTVQAGTPTGAGPVATGSAPDRVDECEYVATVAGGYEGSGTWTLDITREGRTITLDSLHHPPCQRSGVIQPGDRVRAHLGLRAADGTWTYASAGGGRWHLTVGSYGYYPC